MIKKIILTICLLMMVSIQCAHSYGDVCTDSCDNNNTWYQAINQDPCLSGRQKRREIRRHLRHTRPRKHRNVVEYTPYMPGPVGSGKYAMGVTKGVTMP